MPLRRYSKRFDLSQYYFYDDFVGSNYDNRWWTGRGGGGSLTAQADSILRIRATANTNYELYQNDLCDFSVAKNAIHTSRWRVSSLTSMSGEVGFEPTTPDNATDWLAFIYNSDIGANWQAQSAAGGVTTTIDTGVAADTSYHEFRIETTSGTLKYFLDGVLVATITTNISALLLQPYCWVVSKTAATRDVFFDWIETFGDRE